MYKEIFKGAVSVHEKDGVYTPLRLTDKQLERYKGIPRCVFPRASAGIKMEFITNAEKISFSYIYNEIWTFYDGNIPTIDIYVNGQLSEIINIDMNGRGRKIGVECLIGKEKDKNTVTVYFPHNAAVSVCDIEIGNFSPVPERKRKLLVFGDSISQGLMGNTSSLSYVEVYARFFDMEVLNQSVGGDCYDAAAIDAGLTYKPTDVIVALGTNDAAFYNDYDLISDNMEQYLPKIQELYGNCDVTVITPPVQLVWREKDKERDELLKRIAVKAEELCKKCGFECISGAELLPQHQRFYTDDTHPNDLGFLSYAVNLIGRKLK